MKQITRTDDQSLIDVALLNVGNVEALFTMCVDNDIRITDNSEALISVLDTDNRKVVEVLNKPANKPATGLIEPPQAGVGYWRIELDFKVS